MTDERRIVPGHDPPQVGDKTPLCFRSRDIVNLVAVGAEMVQAEIQLPFGIKTTQTMLLANYEAPKLTGDERTLNLAATHRLHEILADEKIEDYVLFVTQRPWGSYVCALKLLIRVNDCTRNWFNLVEDILISEGWGIYQDGHTTVRFDPKNYPINTDANPTSR